ncbi:MAG: DUF3303 family protein [Verrucomicrobiota bacterium]
MKYMLEWRLRPENQKEAAEGFLQGGAPLPDGVTVIGRWHIPGSQRGWLVVDTDDIAAVTEHAVGWAARY